MLDLVDQLEGQGWESSLSAKHCPPQKKYILRKKSILIIVKLFYHPQCDCNQIFAKVLLLNIYLYNASFEL